MASIAIFLGTFIILTSYFAGVLSEENKALSEINPVFFEAGMFAGAVLLSLGTLINLT